MHHDHLEALHAVRDLGLRLKPEDVAAVDVSVHPPFTDLRTVQSLVEGEAIPVLLGVLGCRMPRSRMPPLSHAPPSRCRAQGLLHTRQPAAAADRRLAA